MVLIAVLFIYGVRFIHSEVGWSEVAYRFLGSITFGRVVVVA